MYSICWQSKCVVRVKWVILVTNRTADVKPHCSRGVVFWRGREQGWFGNTSISVCLSQIAFAQTKGNFVNFVCLFLVCLRQSGCCQTWSRSAALVSLIKLLLCLKAYLGLKSSSGEGHMLIQVRQRAIHKQNLMLRLCLVLCNWYLSNE